MSNFRRLANLARGIVKTEARRWTSPEEEPGDVAEEAPRPRAAARPGPVRAAPGGTAEVPAPEERAAPERDEQGEVRRTL